MKCGEAVSVRLPGTYIDLDAFFSLQYNIIGLSLLAIGIIHCYYIISVTTISKFIDRWKWK
jgi:hypothetical protein